MLLDLGWVGLTLISVFHHIDQLPSRFCQIPISPRRVGQTVEHSKFKSTQPNPGAHKTPCMLVEALILSYIWYRVTTDHGGLTLGFNFV